MISGLAPAKLNLYLKVLGQREDKYHDLLTLYQLVSLNDIIWVKHSSTSATNLTVSGPYASQVPRNDELKNNLLFKGYSLFAEEIKDAGFKLPPLEIGLEKNIPAGAGLGGGSSDAACLLKMLRLLFAPDMPLGRLTELGRMLGADIPVFICGFSSWGRGIGDLLSPCHLSEHHYLLFCPELHSSSADLYAFLAEQRQNDKEMVEKEQTDSYKEDGWLDMKPAAANDFYKPLLIKFPELEDFVEKIDNLTPNKLGGRIFLTGSGTTFFAAYGREADAVKDREAVANSKLSPVELTTHLARGINSCLESV